MSLHRLALLCATTTACLTLLACKPVPKPETQTSTPSSAASPVEGVKPHDPSQPAASERAGVPTIGAVEAGQAQGGANTGAPATPTAGDRGASPASAPPN